MIKRNELCGKKILVLGGTTYACEIVNIAHQNNMIVYVADYNLNSPAKKIADKSFLIDIKDVDSIVDICKKELVDGIIFTVLDFIFPYYYEICQRTKLYCYGTMEQFEIMQNKDLFKKYCKKYNVNTIQEYSIEDISNDSNNIIYPIVIKPIDGSASRGITICYNYTDLKKGITIANDYAEKYKRKKGIIAERYMNCHDFIAHYIIVDGDIYLVLTGDRYVTQVNKNCGTVTSAVVYPSIYSEQYLKKAHNNICRLIRGIGIQNGVLFIQMFYDGNDFYCYDPGFRTGGAEVFKFSDSIYGYNQLEMLINYAITGQMCDKEILNNEDYKIFNKLACNLVIMLKPGKIKKILGADTLKKIPEIINITQFCSVGDTITEVGTLAQTIFRIHIITNSIEKLVEIVNYIKKNVKILDSDNNNMIIDIFDAKTELQGRY